MRASQRKKEASDLEIKKAAKKQAILDQRVAIKAQNAKVTADLEKLMEEGAKALEENKNKSKLLIESPIAVSAEDAEKAKALEEELEKQQEKCEQFATKRLEIQFQIENLIK